VSAVKRVTRRLSMGLLAGLALYMALYFPYPEHSLPARGLHLYLELVAALSAALIRTFDVTAYAQGDLVLGQFPLRIVLDCAALDAQALLSVAILVSVGRTWHKLAATLFGVLALFVANIGRIALLQAVGTHRPDWFHVMHEEVLQFGLILLACGLFALWLRLSDRPHTVDVAHAR